MDEADDDLHNICNSIVQNLMQCGINFLAIDFDNTLISTHTGGRHQGGAEDLVPLIRPLFRILTPLALHQGIMVAIVTFSPQTELIGNTLKLQFPDLYTQIVVRGLDGKWEYTGNGSKAGKQAHMASSAQELIARTGRDITRRSTLLVDDDRKNIHAALINSVPAILFNPDDVPSTIQMMVDLRLNERVA